MKVLDLHCAHCHVFEGWFASEIDFQSQCVRGLVTCPVCSDANITKMLSAPRLNLITGCSSVDTVQAEMTSGSEVSVPQAEWLATVRRVLAQTDDVGEQFAEEARKIHYGEVKPRGIRGQATLDQTVSLLEEGIAVAPLLLPESLKGPLQ